MQGTRAKRSRRVFPLFSLLVVASVGCVPRTALMEYRPNRGLDLDAPEPDKALVVFLRPVKMAGYVSSVVFDDQDLVAVLMDYTYAAYQATPGNHRFMVVSEAADFMDADLEAGKVYFALVKVRMGVWRGRFSLMPLTPHDKEWQHLRRWLSRARRVTLNNAGISWGQDHAQSIQQKHDAYLPKWLAKNERPALYQEDGVRLQDLPE